MKIKVSTYALSAVIVLAAAVPFTTAQAAQVKNACGSSSHTMKNPYGSMKSIYGTKHTMKNACGSSKHAKKNTYGARMQ